MKRHRKLLLLVVLAWAPAALLAGESSQPVRVVIEKMPSQTGLNVSLIFNLFMLAVSIASAVIALKSVSFYKKSERAWIIVTPDEWSGMSARYEVIPGTPPPTDPHTVRIQNMEWRLPRFSPAFWNAGKTIGIISEFGAKYLILPSGELKQMLGERQKHDNANSKDEMPIRPDERIVDPPLKPELCESLGSSNSGAVTPQDYCIFVHGNVRYSDIYGLCHETRFGFLFDEEAKRFCRYGGALYNSNTKAEASSLAAGWPFGLRSRFER
jgi:hypothetical protein